MAIYSYVHSGCGALALPLIADRMGKLQDKADALPLIPRHVLAHVVLAQVLGVALNLLNARLDVLAASQLHYVRFCLRPRVVRSSLIDYGVA